MKEKAQLKREHGEILFLQNETTVMVIKAGKSHGGSAVLLNECIGILQKLLSEFTERPEHDRGILMLQPGVWLDEKRRSVWEEGREISVTRREYEVLHMLFRNKGRVLTYEQIYTRVWKEEYYEGRNSVICLMSRLRKKLKMVSCISSIREIGYMYQI